MCDPVSATVGAVSAISTIYQTRQAKKASQAQQEAVQQDTKQQAEAMAVQAAQIEQNAADQKSETALQILRAQASAAVAAAEGGVAGNSVGVGVNSIAQEGAKNLAALNENRGNTLVQNKLDTAGIYSKGQSSVNQIKNNTPTWLGAGLRIGTGLADSYQSWNYRNPGKTNPVGAWASNKLGI